MPRVDTDTELLGWPLWIGKQICKRSRKPFQNGEKVDTVTGITTHPITGVSAFTLAESKGLVECFRTELVSGKPSWNEAPPWAVGLAFKCYGDPGEIGEWCWMAPSGGSPGFLCYEMRSVEHLKGADQRVQDLVMDNYHQVEDRRRLCREQQSLRDKAAFRKKQAVLQ